MYTYRMGWIGALLLLGACSMAPPRPHASVPTLAPRTQAQPMPAVAPAPVLPAAAPVAAPPAPAATVAPVPVARPAHKSVTHRPAPKPAPAKKVVATAMAAPAPATLEVSGHVDLAAARGQQVDAGEQSDTLVYFVADKGGSRARPGRYTVYTHNREFSPEALAVPLGSTVTFVNLDDVRHNVFSVTPGAAFDLGYQASGEKADHAFGRAGIVLVSCNVHHSMELDVLVVPSAYVDRVGADGNFTLTGLPAGPGTLHFWNPRAQPLSQKLILPASTVVRQRIVVTRPRLTTALHVVSTP